MILDMFFRLIFSVGSLLFMILLYTSFVSKNYDLKLRNKLFSFLMTICFSVLILELITNTYFVLGNSQFIYNILLELMYMSIIGWGYFLLGYCYCLIYDTGYDNFFKLTKDTKLLKIFFYSAIAILIVSPFLPVESIHSDVLNFMPGISAYIIGIYYFMCASVVIYLLIKNFKNINLKDKIIIGILVFAVLLVILLQVVLPSITFLGLACTIQILLIYFYYENPDLFMIEEIKKLTKETERISKVKSEFLSNMSHEIRSPMNAIMGFSESLIADPEFDKERALMDINIIESSSKNLLEIINNILDISKIESNQETLEEKNYSFSKIIQDLTAIVQTRISGKPIKLEFNLDEGIPDILYGDSTKIFQVLLNILTNAAKYTEVGKISVNIEKEITDNKIMFHIKVSDTGYGIKKQDYDKMFEKFSRLDEATSNEIEGTGLGLVITKRYVNLMQGDIWFESQYGVGTTFFLNIPQIICEDQTPLEEKEEADNQHIEIVNDLSRFRVLIVDDNKLNIKVAQRILLNYRFVVDTCVGGKECIYKFKEGTHYDMIFMDHMMPELDGIETLHIIRKLDGYYQPPIIVLTANAVAGAKEMYLEEGFDDYLSKPINTNELDRIIDKFLINRQ